MLFVKILVLLWLVNFTPPLLACFMREKWSTPVDLGLSFRDGEPLFGSHKTIRGVAAGSVMGGAAGFVLGFPVWLGLLSGILSMGGDLFSSFVKRRLHYCEGNVVPGL